MTTRHDRPSINLGHRLAGHFPLGSRRRLRIVTDGLDELPAVRQLSKAKCPAGRGMCHLAPRHGQRAAIDAPALGRQPDEQCPGRGRRPAHLRDHGRRGPAAEGSHIKRNLVRIAHHQTNRFDGKAKLVGHGHGQRRAGVLADLDLAGRGCHGSVLGDVQPGPDLARNLPARPAPASAARFLSLGLVVGP